MASPLGPVLNEGLLHVNWFKRGRCDSEDQGFRSTHHQSARLRHKVGSTLFAASLDPKVSPSVELL